MCQHLPYQAQPCSPPVPNMLALTQTHMCREHAHPYPCTKYAFPHTTQIYLCVVVKNTTSSHPHAFICAFMHLCTRVPLTAYTVHITLGNTHMSHTYSRHVTITAPQPYSVMSLLPHPSFDCGPGSTCCLQCLQTVESIKRVVWAGPGWLPTPVPTGAAAKGHLRA